MLCERTHYLPATFGVGLERAEGLGDNYRRFAEGAMAGTMAPGLDSVGEIIPQLQSITRPDS